MAAHVAKVERGNGNGKGGTAIFHDFRAKVGGVLMLIPGTEDDSRSEITTTHPERPGPNNPTGGIRSLGCGCRGEG
jgi:hypothetical protein